MARGQVYNLVGSNENVGDVAKAIAAVSGFKVIQCNKMCLTASNRVKLSLSHLQTHSPNVFAYNKESLLQKPKSN